MKGWHRYAVIIAATGPACFLWGPWVALYGCVVLLVGVTCGLIEARA